jgi:hypothetical protein
VQRCWQRWCAEEGRGEPKVAETLLLALLLHQPLRLQEQEEHHHHHHHQQQQQQHQK